MTTEAPTFTPTHGREARMTMLDDLMPRYDVRERHAIKVNAPMDRVRSALWSTDFSRVPLVGVLMFARRLPAALRDGPGALRALLASRRSKDATPLTLAALEEGDFRLLGSSPVELVLGIEGQFWRLAPRTCTPPAEVFRSSLVPPPGTARGVWNFSLAQAAVGTTTLATETRVLCADAATRRRFLPYWYLIRPGSGLIRHAMLRAVRRTAER